MILCGKTIFTKYIIICAKTLFVSNLFFFNLIKNDFMCIIFVLEFFFVIICAEAIFRFYFVLEFFLVIICDGTFFYVSHSIDPFSNEANFKGTATNNK